MKNLNNYKTNIKNWDKTLESYVDWVSRTNLRGYFAREIKINNFSLWWATNICTKQNLEKNRWYYDLKDCLTQSKKIKYNKLNFYFIFFIKFLKNFIIHFTWFLLIKLLSFSRYNKINGKNCFHSLNYNVLKKGNFLFDRCYVNLPFINFTNKNFHIISIIKKTHFFLGFFNRRKFKKNIPYIVADEYLSIFDIFYIYYKTIIYFFKLKIFISKNHKIFNVQGIDCRNVLEPFLLMSFAGEIQTQLFRGMSINNFIKRNKIKLFITYAEFNPGFRSLYFFVRNIDNPPKIITVQHGHCNKYLMYNFHKKSEFTKNSLYEGQYYSPSPDFYLTQGKQFNQILNSYFPNKTKIIGSLKYDSYKFKIKKQSIKLNKIKLKNKNKKIILLCPSVGDELRILDYLKKSVNFNSRYILSPHPVLQKRKERVINKYTQELKNKCNLEVYNDISTFELLSVSNLVICGFSSVAYEALFFGAQSIRVVNSKHPHFFDLRDNLPVAYSPDKLRQLLNKKSLLKTKKSARKKLLKNYFYKFDNKAHERFWNFVSRI